MSDSVYGRYPYKHRLLKSKILFVLYFRIKESIIHDSFKHDRDKIKLTKTMFVFALFQLWFGENEPLIHHIRHKNIRRGASVSANIREVMYVFNQNIFTSNTTDYLEQTRVGVGAGKKSLNECFTLIKLLFL